MRTFWKEILHALERGCPVELVSVLRAGGSTPRGAGALMALLPDGASTGTVGGGNVEYEAQWLGRTLLERGEDALRSFRFVPGDAASLGMVCGGDVTLHFQYLPAGDAAICSAIRQLTGRPGQGVWLVRRLEGTRVTAFQAVTQECRDGVDAALLTEQPVTTAEGWFSIPVERPGWVYLFGGGHVAQELAAVLHRAEFRVAVYDDRAEFVTEPLFPHAERRLCGSFTALSTQLTVAPEDYVVVMTRGHQADYEVLTQTLRSGARYLGCIGSRRKLALCRERLIAAGFTPTEYDRLHAPIGLDIGAETPAEIAVAVAAELIAVRAGRG